MWVSFFCHFLINWGGKWLTAWLNLLILKVKIKLTGIVMERTQDSGKLNWGRWYRCDASSSFFVVHSLVEDKKWKETKASLFSETPQGRLEAMNCFSFRCSSFFALAESQSSQSKTFITFPFPFGLFLLHAFHFSALWCNPSGVSD